MDSKTYTYHSNDKKILDKLVSSLNCSSPGFIYDGKPLVVVDYEAKVEDVLKVNRFFFSFIYKVNFF